MFLACGLSWLPIKIPPHTHNSPGTYFLPNPVQMWCVQEASCDFPCCNGYFYNTKKGRSVPNSPPILSNSFRKSVIHTRIFSPALSCIHSDSLSCPISLSLFLFHIHTHTPIIRLSNDKRRRRNPKWVTFDPREEAQSYMERVVTVRRGAEVGEERLREAARRTEVPRAGNTG